MQYPDLSLSTGYTMPRFGMGADGNITVLPNIPTSVMNNSGDMFGLTGGQFNPGVAIPGMGAKTSASFGSMPFADKASAVLGGLNTLGSLYFGFKQLGLANKQFDFQKQAFETNLANQMKTYNTALEDRSRSRAVVEGQSPEQAQAYIDRNRMTR